MLSPLSNTADLPPLLPLLSLLLSPVAPSHPRAQQGNEAALKDEVRLAFRANMHETDEAKIVEHKEA